MSSGTYDYEDSSEREWHNLPYDPDSKLWSAADSEEQDRDLRDIAEEMGWRTWADFYDDKLGLARDNPEASRPPAPLYLTDLMIDLHDRGILRYALFEISDNYIEYELDVDS